MAVSVFHYETLDGETDNPTEVYIISVAGENVALVEISNNLLGVEYLIVPEDPTQMRAFRETIWHKITNINEFWER